MFHQKHILTFTLKGRSLTPEQIYSTSQPQMSSIGMQVCEHGSAIHRDVRHQQRDNLLRIVAFRLLVGGVTQQCYINPKTALSYPGNSIVFC